MSRDAFGPNLRRLRIHRGLSIEQIAAHTRIPADLLEGLEQNDFSAWPFGIYARAYVRQYAYAIGEDPDATVDEFCRWYPHGDRRAERVVREHAEIVGHDLVWEDATRGLPDGDRRGAAERDARETVRPVEPRASLFGRVRRAFSKA